MGGGGGGRESEREMKLCSNRVSISCFSGVSVPRNISHKKETISAQPRWMKPTVARVNADEAKRDDSPFASLVAGVGTRSRPASRLRLVRTRPKVCDGHVLNGH